MAAINENKSNLQQMQESGLPLDWTTVLVGWQGFGKHRITTEEVIRYANEQLACCPEEQLAMVCRLADTKHLDHEGFGQALEALAASETISPDQALLKWIVFLLPPVLHEVETYLQEGEGIVGLLQLTYFWNDLDYPAFSPHVLQGVGNNITPQEYYTEENCRRLLRAHHDWLSKTRREIELAALSRQTSAHTTEL